MFAGVISFGKRHMSILVIKPDGITSLLQLEWMNFDRQGLSCVRSLTRMTHSIDKLELK